MSILDIDPIIGADRRCGACDAAEIGRLTRTVMLMQNEITMHYGKISALRAAIIRIENVPRHAHFTSYGAEHFVLFDEDVEKALEIPDVPSYR